MDVYVESNFVLELALLQEQHDSCRALLELAQVGKINLIVPAFCLAEPHETLVRHAKHRRRLHAELDRELAELARSLPYRDRIEAFRDIMAFLVRSEEEERRRLHGLLAEMMSTAHVIDLTTSILKEAAAYQQQFDLPQDAIVYASVLEHLRRKQTLQRCFLNRNSKDFDDPDLREELDRLDCRILFRFDHGLAYVTNQI